MELPDSLKEAITSPQQHTLLHDPHEESKPRLKKAIKVEEDLGYNENPPGNQTETIVWSVACDNLRYETDIKQEAGVKSHFEIVQTSENQQTVELTNEDIVYGPMKRSQPDDNCLKKVIKVEGDLGNNTYLSGSQTERFVWSVACDNLKPTDIKKEAGLNTQFEIVQTGENQQAVEFSNEYLISAPTKRSQPLGDQHLQRSGKQNLQQIEDVCLESDDFENKSLPNQSSYVDEQDFQRKECSIVLERWVSFSVTQDSIPGATLPRVKAYSDELFYMCSDCGVGFSIILKLQSHLWTHIAHLPGHQKEPWKTMYSYNCEECNYIFTSMGLEDHLIHGPHKRHKTTSFKKTHSFKGSLIDQERALQMDVPYLEGNKFPNLREALSPKNALIEIEGFPKLDTTKSEGNRVYVGLLNAGFNSICERQYYCTECGVGFAEQYLQAHLKTHVGKSQTVGDTEQYRCGSCGNYFSLERLKRHLSLPTPCSMARQNRQKKQRVGVDQCLCESCNNIFSDKSELDSHLCKVDESRDEPMPKGGREQKLHPTGPRPEKKRKYVWKIPPKELVPKEHDPDVPFLNGQPLFDSLPRRSTYRCRVCKLELYKPKLQAHISTHMKESEDVAVVNRYCCGYCGKYFTQRKLEEHFSSSSVNRSSTAMKSDQQKSIGDSFIIDRMKGETIMIGERCSGGERSTLTFLCGSCNEAFPEKYKLDCHICEVEKVVEAVGWPEEIFQCEFCYECFESKGSLDRHRSDHTGSQKFTCEVCKKQFTHEFVYWAHKTIHTRDNSTPEEKPTSSSRDTENEQTCDVKVGVTECLDARLTAEDNQLVCHVCGKDFMTILAFKIHMSLHIDAKTTKTKVCDRCKLGFIDKLYMRHACIKRKDDVLICGHCQKKFQQKVLLCHHLYTHSIIQEDPLIVPKSSQPRLQKRAREGSSSDCGPLI